MQQSAKLNAFPVFMRVEGRVATIVGDGPEALAKARLLTQSSARLRIVAETPTPALAAFIAETGAERVAMKLRHAPAAMMQTTFQAV